MATILRQPTQFITYRRPYLQSDPAPNLLVRGIPAVSYPFVPAQFPDIPRRKSSEFGFESQAFLPPGTVATLPFLPVPLPEVMRRSFADSGFTQRGFLPAIVVTRPFAPPQFPEITRRNFGDSLGFEFQSIVPPGTVAGPPPFVPIEWPTPIRVRLHHQDFWWSGVTTRGIPVAVIAPFAQSDWPLPVRPRMAYADSYGSPHILLITPVLRPFAQTDWPPLAMRHPSAPIGDFYFQAWNTIYTPTSPANGFRCRAVTAGIYAGQYYLPGDVFDIRFASDFSDANQNYQVGGNEWAPGWMLQVPSTTALFQTITSEPYPMFPPVDPNRRFVM